VHNENEELFKQIKKIYEVHKKDMAALASIRRWSKKGYIAAGSAFLI
jgi:hypothetical protein